MKINVWEIRVKRHETTKLYTWNTTSNPVFFISFSFRFRLLNSTLTNIVLWRIRADYSYCFESVLKKKKSEKQKKYTKISISFIFLSLLCFSDCRLHDTNLYICSGWKWNEMKEEKTAHFVHAKLHLFWLFALLSYSESFGVRSLSNTIIKYIII